jgi:hypothetical protein
MTVKLSNYTVTIEGAGITMSVICPLRSMASGAYGFAWECCRRFNEDAEAHEDVEIPKIYVYGEMHTPAQFMNRFASIAEKVGAVVEVNN